MGSLAGAVEGTAGVTHQFKISRWHGIWGGGIQGGVGVGHRLPHPHLPQQRLQVLRGQKVLCGGQQGRRGEVVSGWLGPMEQLQEGSFREGERIPAVVAPTSSY
jgi:hypothetical protein